MGFFNIPGVTPAATTTKVALNTDTKGTDNSTDHSDAVNPGDKNATGDTAEFTTPPADVTQDREVTVGKWGTGENDCLSRIVKDNYNVDPYSKEGQEIMNKVIEANPEIYDSGRQGIKGGKIVGAEKNSSETILYDNEKVKLPGLAPAAPEQTTEEGTDNSTDHSDAVNP